MKHGKLVLVRHGESRMNELNLFTGWLDVPLSKKGLDEAHSVADHCRKFSYDAAFTSHLERAHETLLVILSHQERIGVFRHDDDERYNYMEKAPDEFKDSTVPIFMSNALNERAYGELQGKNKELTAREFGEEQVFKWRRGFKDRPPMGESLEDVYSRVIPYFEENIFKRVMGGEEILVSAHGNTLRAMIKYLEKIDDSQIPLVNLPTGHPLIYMRKNDEFVRTEGEYNFDRVLR